MNNIKRVSLILVMTLLIGVLPVFADQSEVFTKEWEIEFLPEGEIVEIEFEYEVPEDLITVPEGIEFIKYDRINSIYHFKALKDSYNVRGRFKYTEEHKVEKVEVDGGVGSLGTINKTPSTTGLLWEDMEYGKDGWYDKDTGRIIYSIKINLDDYRDYDYIIIEDIASENNPYVELINVRYLYNDNGWVYTYDESSDFDFIDKTSFEIAIEVDDRVEAIDIVYYTQPESENVSNVYKVYTIDEWVEYKSSGEVEAEDKEDEIIEEIKPEPKPEPEKPETPTMEDKPEEPVIPEEPEETPIIDDTEPKEPIVEEDPIKNNPIEEDEKEIEVIQNEECEKEIIIIENEREIIIENIIEKEIEKNNTEVVIIEIDNKEDKNINKDVKIPHNNTQKLTKDKDYGIVDSTNEYIKTPDHKEEVVINEVVKTGEEVKDYKGDLRGFFLLFATLTICMRFRRLYELKQEQKRKNEER